MALPLERAAWLPGPVPFPQPRQTAGQQDLCAIPGCQTGPWEVEKTQLILWADQAKSQQKNKEGVSNAVTGGGSSILMHYAFKVLKLHP